MNNNNTVQLSLFSRGEAVTKQYADSIAVVPRFVKKDKKNVLGKDGQPIIAAQTIRLLPRKSEDKPDLADLTGLTGQGLMAFEAEARRGLLKAASSHLMGLIASGYTFDLSRVNLRNGKFMLQVKPAMGVAPVLNPEELKKQAESMGYTLVPIEKEEDETAPAPVPQNGEVEVVKPAAAPATPKKKTLKPGSKAAVVNV